MAVAWWFEKMKISIKRMKQIIQEEVSNHLQQTGALFDFSNKNLFEMLEEETDEDSQLTSKEAKVAIEKEIDLDNDLDKSNIELEEEQTDEDRLFDPKTNKVIKVKVQNKK